MARRATAGRAPGSQDERGSGRRADPARLVAFEVLRASRERDAYANLLLPSLLRERGLTGRDAALATELSYGTLRGQATYDAVIAACSTRGLDQIDPPVRDVLRLGTHQLLATRIGAHAAVATSVDLARKVAGPGTAGFVNAVLRRVATHDLEAWIAAIAPDRAADPLGHLAVRYSHPRWIVAAYSESLGEDGVAGPGDAAPAGAGAALAETEAALAASASRPSVTLCAVPGLADQAELAAAGAEIARWSAFGAYLQGGDPAAVAAVRQGRAAVQDEASQLAALALTRVDVGTPDRLWLDLCAGPGGKARLLAGLAARGGARLVAADIRPHRARLVSAAVTGAAGVVVADGTAPAWRPGSFDRVIADVPCSRLGALQRRLLASALAAARPGGAVAYVTCSPHVGETRAVVADVLAGRDDVAVLDAPAVLAEVPDLRCPEPGGRYAQFWPHRHGTDAIFLALLQRRPPPGAGS